MPVSRPLAPCQRISTDQGVATNLPRSRRTHADVRAADSRGARSGRALRQRRRGRHGDETKNREGGRDPSEGLQSCCQTKGQSMATSAPKRRDSPEGQGRLTHVPYASPTYTRGSPGTSERVMNRRPSANTGDLPGQNMTSKVQNAYNRAHHGQGCFDMARGRSPLPTSE